MVMSSSLPDVRRHIFAPNLLSRCPTQQLPNFRVELFAMASSDQCTPKAPAQPMALAGPASGSVALPAWASSSLPPLAPPSPASSPYLPTEGPSSSLPDHDPHHTACFAPDVRAVAWEAGRLEAEVALFEDLRAVSGYSVYFDESTEGEVARVYAQYTSV